MRESFPSANIKKIPSFEGDFRVFLDGKIIYDKSKENYEFPRIFEITKRIKALN